MKLSQVAQILKAKLIGSDCNFTSLSTDSRAIRAGELFIALVGAKFDGHDFIRDVAMHGAAGAIVNRRLLTDIPQIIVPDTIRALGMLGKWKREQVNVPLIAVTGSCGKTTTRAMLASILGEIGHTLASAKSFNNEIGVPLTLLQLEKHHRFGVIEIGANHFGEINYLVNLVRPQVTLITNAAPAHLEGFHSLDGVACAKGEILRGLSNDGIAVLNADDVYYPYWQHLAEPHPLVTFGVKNNATVTLKDLQLNQDHCASFNLCFPETSIFVELPLLGLHNAINALGAAAAAYALGVDTAAIKAGLEQVVAVNRRLNNYRGFAGATIIDDSYNANPASVSAALEILARDQRKKVFVFGEMLELGAETEKWHEHIGRQARDLNIDCLYVYGKSAPIVAKAFGPNAYVFDNHAQLVNTLKPVLDSNTTVLIKGSLGSAMYLVVEALKVMND